MDRTRYAQQIESMRRAREARLPANLAKEFGAKLRTYFPSLFVPGTERETPRNVDADQRII
jgi:hypothetical protein